MALSSKDIWPPRLETQHLVLRPLDEDDAKAIFEYASNPKVSLYTAFEPHRNISDTMRFLNDEVFPKYRAKVPGPLAIALKVNPQPGEKTAAAGGRSTASVERCIGTIACMWTSEADRTMELGYTLSETYWGRGLIVEAATALIGYMFEHYPVERMQARCFTQNTPSARVMEKLGMTLEGTLRSCLLHRERFWDMHVYAVLRGEWHAAKK